MEDNFQILKYEDFELLRCDKCREYLNCPFIMVYFDPEGLKKPYTECGRCFDSPVKDENLPKPVRNISAETLAAVTPFPCKYCTKGCQERRIWPKIILHEQECMFRTFECPLLEETCPRYLTGIEVLKKYNETYPDLILLDGVIRETFNKDFELQYLIQQNTDLFICKVKYDLVVDKVWFTINLLENRINTECNIEFSDVGDKHSTTLRIAPDSEEKSFDFKAIKSLVFNGDIKCRVYLSLRMLTHSSVDLLKQIRCPACFDYMKGKICVCLNGHSTCHECGTALHNICPVCQEDIDIKRNFSMERIISQGLFSCTNHQHGCCYVSTLDEMEEHLTCCRLDKDSEQGMVEIIYNLFKK